ncbi:MAG TPA: hypothetical protein VN207_02105 [Ktedonobacteraceae bacterium]|nr:hypothetical protein [Ktedonobacteraceae bacterium]
MAASERKEEEREQWRDQTKDLDPNELVFVDEEECQGHTAYVLQA